MDKLETAKSLLADLGMPPKQQSVLCALTLLAMANLEKDTPWSEATNEWIRIHDIIGFISSKYGVIYAENSRETFRKQAMHPFRTAALIEDNGKATNSPNYRYRLTNEFLNVLREVSDNDSCVVEPGAALQQFLYNHLSLTEIYAAKKEMQKMPVRINIKTLHSAPASTTSCKRQSLRSLLRDSHLILNVCMWVILFRKIWLRM